MNTIYRKVWNPTLGAFVVASELAHGSKKGGRSFIAASVAFLAMSMPAFAVELPTFNPVDCDGTACAITVSGGSEVTLTGQGSQIEVGKNGRDGLVSLTTLLQNGQIVSGAEFADPSNPASLIINFGNKSRSVVVPDPITGGTRTVAVYDNANLFDTYAGGDTGHRVNVHTAVNGQQYIGTRIGQVDASGGILSVDIGNGGATDAAGNMINLISKESSLFHADGTGANASRVVWTSNNRVNMGTVSSAIKGEAVGEASFQTAFSEYTGAFTAYDGSAHTVNNAEELRAYNDYLIERLSSGALSPANYDAEFNRAYTGTSRTITYKSGPADLDDEVYTNIGNRSVIHAVGTNATGEVAQGARLDAIASTNTAGAVGAVMRAEQGATIVNNGTIGSVREGNVDGQWAMHAQDGHVINNGTVNAGFFSGLAGKTDPANPTMTAGNSGLFAAGATATLDNAGILNVLGVSSTGVRVSDGAVGVNSGAINMTPSTGIGTTINAVSVVLNSRFTNAAGGEIHLGRKPQSERGFQSEDVANGANAMNGILVGTGGSAVNEGAITLGGLTQGSVGIRDQSSTGTVVNAATGVINVNGIASGAPIENVGMYTYNATKASNEGTINLNGVNGIGIKTVTAGSGIGLTTSSGMINVVGTKSANGLRNYGAWAEGARARVELTGGAVNLAGDGAIGVHARSGGNITLAGGKVDFVSGADQIGFFAHGAGSSVDITSAPTSGLEVNADRSTLFRIEDGARINNAAGASLIASGADSTALQVTGIGSVANLDGMNITVSGDGAVAVKVEGGASGSMSGAANLTLKDGATAVVVDNIKYDINGQVVASAQSSFSNQADVQVLDADDVTAFRVQNGAELINTGDIHLSHGTAIEIVGVGSTVKADGTGKRGTITVDDGVAGIHVHGGATLNTADTITVDNGAAGVLVGADAGRVVIEQGAHVTGKGSSYGSLVVNRAAAGNTLIDGATLEMQGSGAALLTESNLDAGSHGNILVSSNVGGKGIALSAADGGLTDGSLVVGDNWSIDVTGNGVAVYANTSGSLMVDSRRIQVSGPGNAIKADAAAHVAVREQAVITGTHADAQLIVGDMEQLQIAGAVNALTAEASAIALGAGSTVVSITGSVVGQTSLGAGDDVVALEGARVDGAILGDAGSDIFVLRGPQASVFTVLDGGIGTDTDTLVFDSYGHELNDANADQLRNFEQVELNNGSTLDLRTTLALGDAGNGNGSLNIDAGSTLLAFNGPAQVGGNMANAGRVSLGNGVAGNMLVVSGDYSGHGGIVELDTVLGDDASASDRLVIEGASHGDTGLKIHNVGGQGAYTTADGIQVVQVDGSSDGRFALTQRAVAGSHEYLLVQGGKSNPADGDWYLRSEAPPPPSCASGCEPGPGNPVNPQPSEPESPAPVYRPEVAAYQGNQYAASGMFVHTLHDRLGEPDYSERQRGEDDRTAAGWVRVQGRQMDSRAGEQQLKMDTDSWVVQGGAELGRWSAGDSRFHAGVMVGMGKATSRAGSQVTGYSAIGRVQGSSVGVYGTWYQSAADRTGLYVDSWLQYGRYDNQVEGQTLAREDYSASNLTGSLEAGYALRLRESERSTLYLEPQAQVIFSDYNADDHEEANGTVVKSAEAGGLVTRLGARLYGFDTLEGRNRVQPFVEANWWHADRDNAVQLNRDLMTQALPQDRYEVKLGAQAELGGGWTGWGHLGYQQGQDDFQNLEGLVGIKRTW